MDRLATDAGGKLAGKVRIARGFGGEDFGLRSGQRKGKGAKPRKQFGDGRASGQPLARGGYQRSLAILGRLQETTRRERHGHTREGNGHRFRLPYGVGPIAGIECQPGKAVIAGEIEHRLGQCQAFGRQAFDPEIDTLVGQGQLDVGGHPGVGVFALPRLALALPQPDQQAPQRRQQRDQFGT